MSVRTVSWALQQKLASRALKHTLTTLAELASATGHVTISQATLAARLGVSERQARAHLAGLEAVGIIRRQHRNKGNRGRTSDIIVLAIGQTFDITRADLTDAGYDVRNGKFSSGSEMVSSPEGLLPVASPEGNFRANRVYISTGSAEPKRGLSDQGEKATRRRAKPAKQSAPVDSPAPTPEALPPGKDTARRSKARIYARHKAALDLVIRGTVH